ncbi:MAG: CopD family protein, partial [Proteobacteria bacterium]|nr:CopD family protein [Pseudomonadota bacterium]
RTPHHSDSPEIGALRVRLWRLLGVSLLLLAATSAADLATRASAMSGRPLSQLLAVLPLTLTRTHYGHLWLLRPAALAALGPAWFLGRTRLESRVPAAIMMICCLFVVVARCATGHGADQGDLTLPELADCVHLLAASLWAGSLLAVSVAVLPPVVARSALRPGVLADLSARFSTLAGVALGGVLASGLYNAYHELGNPSALWGTGYGRTLAGKLVLVATMITLGACNRYLSVPGLRLWAGRAPIGRGPMHRWIVGPYLARVRERGAGLWIARTFRRRVVAEAVLAVGVLAATSLLIQDTPARHVHPAPRSGPMPGHMSMPDGGVAPRPNR